MAVNKKNLRLCEILHKDETYQVFVALSESDELDNILQEWAIDKLNETLELPAELISSKDITEIIPNVDAGNFVFLKTPISRYMDVSKYAGLKNAITFPTALSAGQIVLPETEVFLYSSALSDAYFGEYSVLAASLPVSSGVSFLGVAFNNGIPSYFMYSDFSSFDFKSIIPVAILLSFGSSFTVIPIGVTGNNLPESILSLMMSNKFFSIDDEFTMSTSSANIILGAIKARMGINVITCPAFNSSLANNDIYLHYKDASGIWQTEKETGFLNDRYQSDSGLVTFGGASTDFVVNYIYRVIDAEKTMVFIALSKNYTSLQDAINNSSEPEGLPSVLKKSAMLVGRIIVQKGSLVPTVQKVRKNIFA